MMNSPSQWLHAVFQWLGGHSPAVLRGESREATHAIAMTGSLVAFATLTTGSIWAIAGYAIAGDSLIGGAVGAVLGASFALSIDRIGAYALDAQTPGRGRTLAMVGIRACACILVSAITTERITPMLLGRDGERIASEQREAKDAARAKALNERYDITGLRANIAQADMKVTAAQAAVATIPATIVKMETDARTCWQTVARRRANLVARGVGEAERKRLLGPLSAHCGDLANAARRELGLYRDAAQKAFAEIVTRQSVAHDALSSAEATINARLAEGSQIDRASITSMSSIVGDSVLNSSPSARRTWIATFAFLLLVELSPFVLKLLSGASAPGARIAVDHSLAVARHMRRRDDAIHADEQRLAVRDRVDAALEEALKSPVVRERLNKLFESKMELLLAFDVARRMIAEMEELHQNRLDATRRYPDRADWINAMADALLDEIVERARDSAGAWPRTAKAA
jgi:hypothetical protein